MSERIMDLTYMVRGADGKEYGPATFEQVSGWVREGRLQAQAPMKRSDMDHWAAVDSFEELQPLFVEATPQPVTAAPAAQAPAPQADALAVAQIRSGGSWFYWVAALSLVNSFSALSGSNWRFIIGLGITQLIDGLGNQLGGSGKAVVLMLDLLAAGLFILFGVFATKGHRWAFIVGMVLFGLDGLIFFLGPSWLDIGFHVFVLYCLFRGFTACQHLARAR